MRVPVKALGYWRIARASLRYLPLGCVLLSCAHEPTAPLATQLVVMTQPNGAVSGLAFTTQPMVRILDATNGLVTTATNVVTATITSGGGTLVGTATATAVAGVVTFTNLQINGAGGHQITFSAAGLTSAVSGTFTVTQNVASLFIAAQPSGATSGSALTTQPVIQIRDNAGLVIATSTLAVTATRTTGSGTLVGTATVTAAAGVATFTNLRIDGSGTHALTFSTAAPVLQVVSATFVVALAPSFGAITGVVLGDDGNALNDTALLGIVATSTFAPYQQMSFSRDEGSERSYSVASLHAGKWALTFSVIHGWTFVFPGLYLYADTTLIVDVVAGQTAVVPDLLMRSRPPLLLVGLETCPGLPDPPTLADWGVSCDSGYWGGAAALITVTGVAGTNTASVHREGMIGPAAYTRPASFWQNTPWSTYFDMEILGDYDVTIALTPDASRPSWRLVPWQTTSRRVTVGKGLSYTEFDFWYK